MFFLEVLMFVVLALKWVICFLMEVFMFFVLLLFFNCSLIVVSFGIFDYFFLWKMKKNRWCMPLFFNELKCMIYDTVSIQSLESSFSLHIDVNISYVCNNRWHQLSYVNFLLYFNSRYNRNRIPTVLQYKPSNRMFFLSSSTTVLFFF